MADVFISHAWEDKDAIARPLAEKLKRLGLSVWYDEYVLTIGDSLRQVIDKGLASSRFGVVILSPAFFSKPWPLRELDGLLARENSSGVKVLLPVWHGLKPNDVVRVSPLLADRLAVSTDCGLETVVEQILRAMGETGPVAKPPAQEPASDNPSSSPKDTRKAAAHGIAQSKPDLSRWQLWISGSGVLILAGALYMGFLWWPIPALLDFPVKVGWLKHEHALALQGFLRGGAAVISFLAALGAVVAVIGDELRRRRERQS